MTKKQRTKSKPRKKKINNNNKNNKSPSTTTSKHLFILQHGLWGDPIHVSHIRNKIIQEFNNKNNNNMEIHTHLVQSNKFIKTYSGIRQCAYRLYNECKPIIDTIQPTHISFIGYSAGGLFIRYAISLFDQDGLFDMVKPMNLYLLCSPNAGTNRFEQQDYDIFPNINLYNFALERIPSFIGGETAKEFVFQDQRKQKRQQQHYYYPLIHLMSLDPFVSTIRKFKIRKIYGNIYNDRAVGFRSGCLYPYDNPYDKYEHINPFTNKNTNHTLGQYIGCKINLINMKNGKERKETNLKPINITTTMTKESMNILRKKKKDNNNNIITFTLRLLMKILIYILLFTIIFPFLILIVFPIWYFIARICYFYDIDENNVLLAEEEAMELYDKNRKYNDTLNIPKRTLEIIHNLRDNGIFTDTIHCWLPGMSSHGVLVCRNYEKPWVPNARDGASVVNDMIDGMVLE